MLGNDTGPDKCLLIPETSWELWPRRGKINLTDISDMWLCPDYFIISHNNVLITVMPRSPATRVKLIFMKILIWLIVYILFCNLRFDILIINVCFIYILYWRLSAIFAVVISIYHVFEHSESRICVHRGKNMDSFEIRTQYSWYHGQPCYIHTTTTNFYKQRLVIMLYWRWIINRL